ncbi:MAG: hypothetical protein AB1Y25_01090 [Cycloclasticus sp.]
MKHVIGILITVVSLFYVKVLYSAEYSLHGIIDMRASRVDSANQSYLDGDQGKFALADGQHLAVAQAGAQLAVEWDNGLSAHGVINGFYSADDSALGFTEAYLKYRGLPNSAGYRVQSRLGIFYPEISLENNAYAWASKDTLNSSMINSWIGEEIRVLGSEFKVTRLGRMNNDAFDLSLSASAFVNNDPAGALLAWHGWTSSSRQTLWTEKQPLPWFPARGAGGALEGQAAQSDPFLEIDHKVGYHLRAEWLLPGKGEVSFGYYNNRATPYKVVNGQYGWQTRFYHLAGKWRLMKGLTLKAQYLNGDTLMQSELKQDIVNNDYASGFVSLSYQWQAKRWQKKHSTTLRLEDFSVTDNDNTLGDNNNEDGHAVTLNHSYRLAKQWFLSAEVNYIDSHRPARDYTHQSIDLVEKKLQLAVRYFY